MILFMILFMIFSMSMGCSQGGLTCRPAKDGLTWCDGTTTFTTPCACEPRNREFSPTDHCVVPIAQGVMTEVDFDENEKWLWKDSSDGFAQWMDKTRGILTTVELEDDAHANDIFLKGWQATHGAQLPLEPNAVVYGIEVSVMMISRQKALPGMAGIRGNVFCYVNDIRFWNGEDESGDRGVSYGRGGKVVPNQWTELRFGGSADVWDVFGDPARMTPELEIEIDAKTDRFNQAMERIRSDEEPTNTVTCEIAGVQITIFHKVRDRVGERVMHLLPNPPLVHYSVELDDDSRPYAPSPDGTTLWYQPNYRESVGRWLIDAGLFGYGGRKDNEEDVHLDGRSMVGYFRIPFEFNEKLDCIDDLHFRLRYDDGLIMYLNGEMLWAINMPLEGNPPHVSHNTLALRSVDFEEEMKTVVLHGHPLLKVGSNLLAVEVHQTDRTSSDLHFQIASLAVYVKNNCDVETTGAVTTTTKGVAMTTSSLRAPSNSPATAGPAPPSQTTSTDSTKRAGTGKPLSSASSPSVESPTSNRGADTATAPTVGGPNVWAVAFGVLLVILAIGLVAYLAYRRFSKPQGPGYIPMHDEL